MSHPLYYPTIFKFFFTFLKADFEIITTNILKVIKGVSAFHHPPDSLIYFKQFLI